MAGAPKAVTSSAKPKAHLSVSVGTRALVRPALDAVWYRVFSGTGLQPGQFPAAGPDIAGLSAGQKALAGGGASTTAVPRNVATASRSSRRRGYAMLIIKPKSSVRWIRAADIFWIASRVGIRGVTWS